MGLGVLERLKASNENSKTVLKTIQHGNLQVHNVPHNLYLRGIGPDGNQEYIDGSVMYKLTSIFKMMVENGLSEYDYKNF